MRFILLVLVGSMVIANCEWISCQTLSVRTGHQPILGQPTTVETGTEEAPAHVGFLQCVTDYLHAQMKHSNTVVVFANLTSIATSNDSAIIVGHGAPGLICTGNGDHCSGNQDLMGAGTTSAWQPFAIQLKGHFKDIAFVGCDIASGRFGAQFLSAFANATGATVHAPDDTVQCEPDGISILNGGNWIQVSPTGTPPAKEAPQPSSKTQTPQPGEAYQFMVESGFKSVHPPTVEVVSFQHRGYYQKEFADAPPERVHSLISLIDFAHPLFIKGSLGSIVTGRLTLRMKIDDRQVERQFVLLNDKLLEDKTYPTVFYKTTEGFQEQISLINR